MTRGSEGDLGAYESSQAPERAGGGAAAATSAAVEPPGPSSEPGLVLRGKSAAARLWWLPDALILAFLGILGWLAAGKYVTGSLFVFGDHPGQFMRFWYLVATSLPRYGRILDWNPLWYAGYPELQFYPPGHALTGLLLNALTLGRLGPERVYNLIPVIALVLPGFTAFAFLRVVLAPLGHWPARVGGLVAAWLALTFTPMWGGTNAVPIGMLGERLAFGLAPLVLLAGWRLVDAPSRGRLIAAALALAALMLMHPFHAPAVVLAASGYALAGWAFARGRGVPGRPRPVWPWLLGWLALAVGLVAWWLVPLLARQTPYAASLIRTNLGQTRDWLETDPISTVAWAALPALALLWHRDIRLPATVTALAALIPVLALGILFDAVVLREGRLNFTAFDPIRFIAEYYIAWLLLAGAAAGCVTSRFLWRRPPLATALALLLVFELGTYMPVFAHDLRIWTNFPARATKDELFRHAAFNGLWDALRNDPAADGRVLFTSYYLEVPYPDGWNVSTAIKAMTPYLTGREIVGGTFSHWSPVARLLWVGKPWTRVLPERVELEDDQGLFGVAWRDMDDRKLHETLQALNVSTIVADGHDTNARTRLDASPRFERFWDNGWFYLYHLKDAAPAWIAARGADARLTERTPRRWSVQVDHAGPGATLTARMAAYPLWRAEAAGHSLPITADDYAQQQIELPPGGPYMITFTYREAWPEWAGLILTVFSVLLVVLWRSRRRATSASNPPSGKLPWR